MRAHKDAAPLVVVRSEAESGGVGLRLIGELDLNTVELLEAELAGSREQSAPAVIDLSELRFLDLAGLRALLRAGQADGTPATRLVGATGIVQRLISLAHVLDAEGTDSGGALPAGESAPATTNESAAKGSRRLDEIATNGNSNTPSNGDSASNGNGKSRAAGTGIGDAP